MTYAGHMPSIQSLLFKWSGHFGLEIWKKISSPLAGLNTSILPTSFIYECVPVFHRESSCDSSVVS